MYSSLSQFLLCPHTHSAKNLLIKISSYGFVCAAVLALVVPQVAKLPAVCCDALTQTISLCILAMVLTQAVQIAVKIESAFMPSAVYTTDQVWVVHTTTHP